MSTPSLKPTFLVKTGQNRIKEYTFNRLVQKLHEGSIPPNLLIYNTDGFWREIQETPGFRTLCTKITLNSSGLVGLKSESQFKKSKLTDQEDFPPTDSSHPDENMIDFSIISNQKSDLEEKNVTYSVQIETENDNLKEICPAISEEIRNDSKQANQCLNLSQPTINTNVSNDKYLDEENFNMLFKPKASPDQMSANYWPENNPKKGMPNVVKIGAKRRLSNQSLILILGLTSSILIVGTWLYYRSTPPVSVKKQDGPGLLVDPNVENSRLTQGFGSNLNEKDKKAFNAMQKAMSGIIYDKK